MSQVYQVLTYTTAGTYTITVPQGVSKLEMYLWGGGGADGTVGAQVKRQVGQKQIGQILVGQQQIGQRAVRQVATGAVPSGVRLVANAVQEYVTGYRQEQVQVGTRSFQVQVGTKTTTVQVGTRVVTPGVDAVSIPAGSQLITGSTTGWKPPAGITTVNIWAVGAGGSGGDGAGVDGIPDGGSAGSISSRSGVSVPIGGFNISIGTGGTSVGYGSGKAGIAGTATTVTWDGGSITAAGGAGGRRANGSNINGRSSGDPFNGAGGAGRWGDGADGRPGGVGAGGGGIDGSASGQVSGRGGHGGVFVSWASKISAGSPAVTEPVYGTQQVPIYETRTEPIFQTVTVPVVATNETPIYETVFQTTYETVYEPIYESIYDPVYEPIYETVGASPGGRGAGGGYAYKFVGLTPGDLITVAIGSAGQGFVGGTSLITNGNYRGGTAGTSGLGGRGGGGGGATVVLVNGVIQAAAAGGGGGGGGSSNNTFSGGNGVAGTNVGVGIGTSPIGQSSSNSNASGGGGGGGLFGGAAGASGDYGRGGQGGVNLGSLIESGVDDRPGGINSKRYPGRNRGYAGYDGAAVLVFVKDFNIAIKRPTVGFQLIADAWLKVNNQWTVIANAWTKVADQWRPLVFNTSVVAQAVSYSLTASSATVNEGGSVTFTLTTLGIDNGTIVPYTIVGIDANDLASGSLTGSFVVGTTMTATFVIREDFTTEGSNTMTMILNNTSTTASCTILDTSLSPGYSLTRSQVSINEGQTVTFTLGTSNVAPGTILQYFVTGITADDLTVGSSPLIGNFVVGSAESVSFTPRLDNATTGNKTIKIQLYGKAVSSQCEVIDTSITKTYGLLRSTDAINEGQTVAFTLVTTGDTTGEVIPYTITGIDAADLASGSLTGNFVVGSVDTISFTSNLDFKTEGNETLTITIPSKSISSSCVIRDGSTSPTYQLQRSSASIFEGQPVTFTLVTSNVPTNAIVPYTVTGINAADLETGSDSLTGQFVVGQQESKRFKLKYDSVTEGAETLTLTLDGRSISQSCTVNDSIPSYILNKSASNINEGQSVTFTLITANVNVGESVTYNVTGIDSADITGNSSPINGAFIVGSSETITYNLLADRKTEGTETINVSLYGKGVTANCTINDTSTDPTYALSTNKIATDEGGTVVFTLTTTNVDNGFPVFYRVGNRNTENFDEDDLAPGSDPLSGYFIVGTKNTVSIITKADKLTEGTEGFAMNLLGRGIASPTVTLNDTSQTPSGETTLQSLVGAAFIVPDDVYSVTVTIRGAGGGGGGGHGTTSGGCGNTGHLGGNGGGGEIKAVKIFVTPGQPVFYRTGQGGVGGVGNNNGAAGGESKINLGLTDYIAVGGGGGVKGTSNGRGAAGTDYGGGNGGVGGAAKGGVGTNGQDGTVTFKWGFGY